MTVILRAQAIASKIVFAFAIVFIAASCSQQQPAKVQASPPPLPPKYVPTPVPTAEEDTREAQKRIGVGDYDGARKLLLRARGKMEAEAEARAVEEKNRPPAPANEYYTGWKAGDDLAKSVQVGGEYSDFENRRWTFARGLDCRLVSRTDYVGGFSETYQINGDYLSFSVSDGVFTRVTR